MLAADEVIEGLRFVARVGRFLRQEISPAQARALVAERLAHREADFLAIARETFFASPLHPYRRLLDHAGCEYDDLARLVRQDGLEGALRALMQRGVYLTIDELRGRRPVVRGSLTLHVASRDFRNPAARPRLSFHSGGSRNATAMPLDLAHTWDRAVNAALTMEALGGGTWNNALWKVPGSSGMNDLLENRLFRARTTRWFSPVDPNTSGLHPRYRWSARALRLGSALGGISMPSPQYVAIEDPVPIARWMAQTMSNGETPHVRTYASLAVRICEAATQAGIALQGSQFTVSGEPITAARLAAISRSGARAVASCGASEAGSLGKGCLDANEAGDLHFFDDLHAAIQPGLAGTEIALPDDALLLTSLRASSRFLLLNACLGDRAVLERRPCGCPMEQYGWTTHLHGIRSFEKLTAGGMTFLDTDAVRVLEEWLPARFGGGPTDYQLVDEAGDHGEPRVTLLVHPRLGPVDEDLVRESFLDAIAPGSGAERVMAEVWRHSGILTVKREAPRATGAGKISHVHAANAVDSND